MIASDWTTCAVGGVTYAFHLPCKTAFLVPQEHACATAARWRNATIACAICSREWVAVFPDEAPALECSGCGYLNAVPS